MGIHAGWENTLDIFWEFPLGTMGTSGFRYLSDVADSLSIGAQAHGRRVVGNRFFRKEHLRILSTAPGGGMGPTPFWFDSGGNHKNVNRLLNSHFQNTSSGSSVLNFVRHFPVSAQPANLGGFTIRRNIGLGNDKAYVWRSAIADQLTIEWKAGQPITMTPTMLTMEALPGDEVEGATADTSSAYQNYYYMAPALQCTWNGTEFFPAGWKITSKNNTQTKYGPNSKAPTGFAMGVFEADFEMDVWIEDDFIQRYVPADNLGTSPTPTDLLGTFVCKVQGPMNESGLGEDPYYTTFNFIGKIIEVNSGNPNLGNPSTQKIKMKMVASGTTYNTCGYYIEVDGELNLWQTPDGL